MNEIMGHLPLPDLLHVAWSYPHERSPALSGWKLSPCEYAVSRECRQLQRADIGVCLGLLSQATVSCLTWVLGMEPFLQPIALSFERKQYI